MAQVVNMQFAITYIVFITLIFAGIGLLTATRDHSIDVRDFGASAHTMTQGEFVELPSDVKDSFVYWVLDQFETSDTCVLVWKRDPGLIAGLTVVLIEHDEESLKTPAVEAVLGALAIGCSQRAAAQ